MKNVYIISILLFSFGNLSNGISADNPNILLIVCDDLNHWVGHLDRNPDIITPNIDSLAKRGVSFSSAYCASAQCNPSRASMFSGLRPYTSGVYANSSDWEKSGLKKQYMLNRYFKSNGYTVLAAGKVHNWIDDDPLGFDAYQKRGSTKKCDLLANGQTVGQTWGIYDGGDACSEDEKTVSWVVNKLGESYDNPFLIIAGLYKPHLQWNVPKKYYDLYPLDSVKLPPIKEDDLDDLDMDAAFAIAGRKVHTINESELDMKKMVRGYMATVSYCDAQVGRILTALKNGPNNDNTHIILISDHGYHLGEKFMAAKRLLWEEANRIPYIWVAPGIIPENTMCHQPADLMTLYPTMCELANLPIPIHVEGVSVFESLKNPHNEYYRYAVSTYRENNHTVRTKKWRYIKYKGGAEELYNEETDKYEWYNLANNSSYSAIKDSLEQLLTTTVTSGMVVKTVNAIREVPQFTVSQNYGSIQILLENYNQKPVQVSVYNISGHHIYSNIFNTQIIDLQKAFSNGLYVVSVNHMYKKVVVNN